MPAAVLTHILHRIVYPEQAQTLLQIVREARDTVRAPLCRATSIWTS